MRKVIIMLTLVGVGLSGCYEKIKDCQPAVEQSGQETTKAITSVQALFKMIDLVDMYRDKYKEEHNKGNYNRADAFFITGEALKTTWRSIPLGTDSEVREVMNLIEVYTKLYARYDRLKE